MTGKTDHKSITVGEFGSDERGVSEVVAFILVFGIVLGSIGLLSVTGFQAMDDYQRFEQQRNADRAMSALAENFNDVLRYGGIDQRSGELALRGGTIATDSGGTELNVSVDRGSGHEFIGNLSEFDEIDGDQVELGEFSYESDSGTLYYDGGAVVREADGGAVVLEEPHLEYDEDSETAIVSLVRIDADSRAIQSSESTGFTLTVESRSTAVLDSDDGLEEISVRIDDPEDGTRDEAWEDELDGWRDGRDVDRAVITVVTVDIEY